MTHIFEKRANKGCRQMSFEPRDLVWVLLHKDLFLEQRKSQLHPHVDGPFKVLRKIHDNAYEINLPNTYGVSTSFNVSDLFPLFGLEVSRMTFLKGGGSYDHAKHTTKYTYYIKQDGTFVKSSCTGSCLRWTNYT
jgi:hypothetical protein